MTKDEMVGWHHQLKGYQVAKILELQLQQQSFQ